MVALLVVGLVIVIIGGLVWLSLSQNRGKAVYSNQYLKGPSILISKKFGIAYVNSVQDLGDDSYTYDLELDGGNRTLETFQDYEIRSVNKHLGLVGKTIMITTDVVAALLGDKDVNDVLQAFNKLKGDFAEVQSKYNDLQANVDAEVARRVESTIALGMAFKPTFKKGG